jgi:3D (Asp-Asp-Asp) domain-containing protein/peptidoglycan hydrolase CwlO-like protein
VKAHSTSDAARLAAVFTGLLLLASVPVAVAADAGDLRSQAAGLQARSGSLDARVTAATLELYSLESQLSGARTELAAIEAQRASLAREQASARTQLTVAKGALLASQTELANLVRALYQQSGNDPLAVLLGAKSLEEALAGLDGISRAAGQNNRIVEQAREARTRLAGLAARLAERDAELDGLAEAAQARSAALAATAAERRRFIGALRRQQGLNAARVAAIQAQARTAATQTTAVAVTAPPPPLAPVEVAAPLVTATGERLLTVRATGYSIRGRTATGIPTAPGVVAVDPSVIPLGTRLTIPGYGVGIAADTGGAVVGNTIDVWFPTTGQALQWGSRTITVTLH